MNDKEKYCNHCKKLMPDWARSYAKYCDTTCQEKANYKRRKGTPKGYLEIRFNVLARDKFSCVYCGRNAQRDRVILHVDHWVSCKKGGKFIENNLFTACSDCNLGKGENVFDNSIKPKINDK